MIGLIDSGIGGVTVLKEICKILPKTHYIYYSDSKNNPYGEKEENMILELVEKIVLILIQKGCNIIVLACNTASAICVDILRKKYPEILFIAIEPAIKMVKDGNYKGLTLILATPKTLQTEKFQKTYQKYKTNQCLLVPCPGLADLIEEDKTKEIKEYIDNIFKTYPDAKNFVLGCTHYPLIKDLIHQVYPNSLFFDGSIGVSKELKKKIEEYQIPLENLDKVEFFDSSNSKIKKERFYKILKK